MRSQFEREGPTHIDVSMRDRRDLSQELIRKLLWRLPREDLHLLGIPGGSVANPAAVRRDEVRAGGSSRVGLQGTPLRGRDRALGGALVLSLRGELPRPRADDG